MLSSLLSHCAHRAPLWAAGLVMAMGSLSAQDPQPVPPPAPPPGESVPAPGEPAPEEIPESPEPSPEPPADGKPMPLKDVIQFTPVMLKELERIGELGSKWAMRADVLGAMEEYDAPDPIAQEDWERMTMTSVVLRDMLTADGAVALKAMRRRLAGAFVFVELRDANGMIVAATRKPRLFDRGADPLLGKVRRVREAQRGDPEADSTARKYWVSVVVPVVDSAVKRGKPVAEKDRKVRGTLELAVDLKHLARLALAER